MNPKKPSLKQVIAEESSRRKRTPSTPANQDIAPSAEPSKTKGYVQPGRRHTKQIVGHFDPAVSKQLKQLALERDTTIQGLLGEALNDLFIKYEKSPIARVPKVG